MEFKYNLRQRISSTTSPLLKKLYQIMINKETNICLAADFGSFEEAIEFVHLVGPHICILKTHAYRLTNDFKVMKRLNELKQVYNFLIFEDFKFNDDMEQIKHFYKEHIIDYADLVTVDPVADFGVFEAVKEGIKERSEELGEQLIRGCLSLLEVSFGSSGQAHGDPRMHYTLTRKYTPDPCVGVIAQKFDVDCDIVKLSPGVRIGNVYNKSQNWNHPTQVMANGADILVVGRGITQETVETRLKTLLQYKSLGFERFKEFCTDK